MEKYLIVNLGSASKKYSLYEDEQLFDEIQGREIFRAHFEKENGDFAVTENISETSEKNKISQSEYEHSGKRLRDVLISKKLVKDAGEIAALGFRVVAPGEYFAKTRTIDAEYREKLKEAYEIAPLHVEAVLKGIEEFASILPDTPMIGVSDSAFHATIPETARLYALPAEDSRKYGVYRYGYHGISVASVLNSAEKILGGLPPRVIVCHLGSGSSVTAIKDGKSVDTSMGFTPLEGVAMATRSGDIDPGALFYLGKKLNLSYDEMDEYLNRKCGLLGLSGGRESGVRELLELEKSGDPQAKSALDVWVYRVKKYIGAYAAALGGLDLLIFTATIGERSPIIRSRVCAGLEFIGLGVDREKNERLTGAKGGFGKLTASGFIEKCDAPVKIAVIPTDEAKEIARETKAALFSE